jgi:hypothetical protein
MFRFLLGGGIGLATLLGVVVAPAVAAAPLPHRIIFATDVCDPATFNAAFGPNTCNRTSPGVPLNTFENELRLLHFATGWMFTPGITLATTTDPIRVQNIGGETHTFTEVKHFGGGFVPLINQLGGFGTPAPECLAPPGDDNTFIPAGGSFTFTEGEPGTHLYQCCIHPWMHESLTIRPTFGLVPR